MISCSEIKDSRLSGNCSLPRFALIAISHPLAALRNKSFFPSLMISQTRSGNDGLSVIRILLESLFFTGFVRYIVFLAPFFCKPEKSQRAEGVIRIVEPGIIQCVLKMSEWFSAVQGAE